MNYSQPLTLTGKYATLVPLSMTHCDDLIEAVKDGELWNVWYNAVPTPDDMAQEIERRLTLQTEHKMNAFAIIDNKTQKAVGMTTYLNIDEENRRVEIGYTWYKKSVQKTPMNTECKLMLLTHAFEKFNCIAVNLCTSTYNHNSRRAIERLGAKLDGILRNRVIQAKNGIIRDSCIYSIIDSEWPVVKLNLEYKLSEYMQKNYTNNISIIDTPTYKNNLTSNNVTIN